jgi:hypothetical protein
MSSKKIKAPLPQAHKPLPAISAALLELFRAIYECYSRQEQFDEVNVRVQAHNHPRLADALNALDLTVTASRWDRRVKAIKERNDLERRIQQRLLELQDHVIDGHVLVRDKKGWCRIVPATIRLAA